MNKWLSCLRTPLLLFGLLAITQLTLGCALAREAAERPAHHDSHGFRNPHQQQPHPSAWDYWRMRWFGDEPFPDPDQVAGTTPQMAVELTRIHQPPAAPQITWIGHATVLIQYRGLNILTDPIFSERASPLSFAGPKRLTPPALRIDQLPPIHYVVISHNHYDHLDLPSLRALGNQPHYLVPLGLKATLQQAGIRAERITELDWWQQHQGPGILLTATPVQHWSARSLWDRFATLWAGWAITIDHFKLWFGGDTGYNPLQFKQIGLWLGPFDLALIPIGAYAPRWFMQPSHITPDEAVIIHREIGSRYSIGIQWGTFIMTSEPLGEPPCRLATARDRHQIPPGEFEVLKIGESRLISLPPPENAPPSVPQTDPP